MWPLVGPLMCFLEPSLPLPPRSPLAMLAEVPQHNGSLSLSGDSYPAIPTRSGQILVVLLLLAALAKVYAEYGVQARSR